MKEYIIKPNIPLCVFAITIITYYDCYCSAFIFGAPIPIGIGRVTTNFVPPVVGPWTKPKSMSINFSSLNTKSSVHHLNKRNQEREKEDKQKSTQKVEDGSVLGVAIVSSGLLFTVLQNKGIIDINAFNIGDDDNFVWIVFCTASIVAGISRIVRYNMNK